MKQTEHKRTPRKSIFYDLDHLLTLNIIERGQMKKIMSMSEKRLADVVHILATSIGESRIYTLATGVSLMMMNIHMVLFCTNSSMLGVIFMNMLDLIETNMLKFTIKM